MRCRKIKKKYDDTYEWLLTSLRSRMANGGRPSDSIYEMSSMRTIWRIAGAGDSFY